MKLDKCQLSLGWGQEAMVVGTPGGGGWVIKLTGGLSIVKN